MLHPSLGELLEAMADALRDTVLPELAPGPAAEQVRDAVALTRRIAVALPQLHRYLCEDGADVATVLDALAPRPDGPPRRAAWPEEPPPPLDALIAADLSLREELAALATATTDGAAAVQLRALLQRMAEREDALRLSPWARLPRR